MLKLFQKFAHGFHLDRDHRVPAGALESAHLAVALAETLEEHHVHADDVTALVQNLENVTPDLRERLGHVLDEARVLWLVGGNFLLNLAVKLFERCWKVLKKWFIVRFMIISR
jgi:hypothetical protein